MEENTNIEQETTKNKVNKIVVFIGLFLVIIVAGFYIYKVLGCVSTDDAYIETTTVQLSPKVSGQLVKVLVEDNQFVHEGDLIAQIEDNDYIIKAEQATARYNEALLNQKNAQANHLANETQISVAKADFDRYEALHKAGAVSQQEYDIAMARYEKAKASLTNTQEALISKDGKSVADAQISALKAQKEQADLYLSYTKIYAPQSGTVSNKKASVGMMVQPGTPLLTIVPKQVWIVANYKENQLEHIRVGQKVKIHVDAYPHEKFTGVVDSIQRASGAKASMFPPENAVGSFVKIVQRIPVKIVFTDITEEQMSRIVPGMSVIPEINIRDSVEKVNNK